MAEYSYTNSAKRRQHKQFSPERRQWPEGKKRHGRRPRSKGDDSPNKRVGEALMDDAQPRRPPAGKDE